MPETSLRTLAAMRRQHWAKWVPASRTQVGGPPAQPGAGGEPAACVSAAQARTAAPVVGRRPRRRAAGAVVSCASAGRPDASAQSAALRSRQTRGHGKPETLRPAASSGQANRLVAAARRPEGVRGAAERRPRAPPQAMPAVRVMRVGIRESRVGERGRRGRLTFILRPRGGALQSGWSPFGPGAAGLQLTR